MALSSNKKCLCLFVRILANILLAGSLLTILASCSGGKDDPTIPHFTIGGTVSGLAGSGLVLQNNASDDLIMSANGSFTFSTSVTSGTTYAVTVKTPPTVPLQTCTINNGSGTVSHSDVTNITVNCINSYTVGGKVHGLSGSGLLLQNNSGDDLSISDNGAFTFAIPLISGISYAVTVKTQPTVPPQTCTVSNSSGTVASAGVTDVTVVCISWWTWVSGDNVINRSGVYGTKGIANGANKPGARYQGVSWIDKSGNLWLFGGWGIDSTIYYSFYLNDLWKFDGINWTWVSGDDLGEQGGVYGTKGVAAGTNIPGARHGSVSWIDSSGNLWLFGGYGNFATRSTGYLNDLWKFDGTNWTWVSGDNVADQRGIYGTKGVANGANKPGSRDGSVSWIDNSGNLWLFGGQGYDSVGNSYLLNDLWKFDGTNWTWVSGDNVINQSGVYGTKGVAAENNKPGSRGGSVGWIDSIGNLWLFGGWGYASTSALGYLNDLWKFDGTNWTWVSGDNVRNDYGGAVYGTQGIAAENNKPGSRSGSVMWKDKSGNIWLFGGLGYRSYGGECYFNDLWKFDGTNWTWVSGDNRGNQSGIYGTKGVAAGANKPGSRHGGNVSWIDSSGNLWLFGGFGLDSAGNGDFLNDLWKYTP